jgi:hypothetical protein
MLKQKWKESFSSHKLASTDNLTVDTASMSLEEMSSMESCMDSDGDSESDGTIARSNNSSEDSSDESSEDSSEESRDGFIESFSNEWDDSSNIREGDDDQFHAMVLLGTNQVDGTLYWVLQNSWASMQIIEMSTEYLAKCRASITFLSKASRYVKESSHQSAECCSAPMAESSILESMDCENWDDDWLISSGVQNGACNEGYNYLKY